MNPIHKARRSDLDDHAADELVVERLVLAVPHRPQHVEETGDDQHPEEGRDERSDEGADVPERPVLVAIKADRSACRRLADRLPALGVAGGVVTSACGSGFLERLPPLDQ